MALGNLAGEVLSRAICPPKSIRIAQTTRIRPRHMCNDVSACELISIEAEEDSDILRITESGDIPVVTYDTDNSHAKTLRIRRKASSDQYAWVAISHVRADGLGNDEKKALPRCLVEWLQTVVNKLYEPLLNPVPFWIDTFCLPLQEDERKRAIKHMRQIFTQCNKVIVLDSSLCNAVPESPIEQFYQIRKSGWLTRLWTLQEGAVARSLCFYFRSQIKELDTLLEECTALGVLPTLPQIPSGWSELRVCDRLTMLGLLDYDIKAFESSLGGKSDPRYEYEKQQLRSVLRLGYLSLPRFQPFASMQERVMFSTVVEAICSSYRRQVSARKSSTNDWDDERNSRSQRILDGTRWLRPSNLLTF